MVMLLLSLATACIAEPPCPLRDSMPRLDVVNLEQQADDRARAIATNWATEHRADPGLVTGLARAIDQQASSFPFWEALRVAEPRYAVVANRLAARQLPDALAVIPFALSGYLDTASAPECRAGPWLLPPTALGLRVAKCRLRDSATLWSPPGEPAGGMNGEHGCRIQRCDTDDRRSFSKATDAVLTTLEATWRSVPDAPGKLEARLASETGYDISLVLAWHVLAVCFYGDTDQTDDRWRPRPVWCKDAPPMDYALVARCSAEIPVAP
jgi:hypothetical protein